MSIRTHCTRRDGRYYFRVRVPSDLVTMLGRSELRKSLCTSDPQVARRRAVRASGRAMRLFEHLRRVGTMLTPEMIAQIVRQFYENWLGEDLAFRHIAQLAPESADELEREILNREATQQEIRHELARGKISRVQDYADSFLVDFDLGDEIDDDAVDYRDLCHGLLRALLEVNRRAAERDQGMFYGQPSDPLVCPPPAPAAPTTWVPMAAAQADADLVEGSRLECLTHLEAFMAEKTKAGLSEKSKNDYRKSLATFAEVIGAKATADVSAADVLKFKDVLLATPVDFKNRLKVETIAEAVEKNGARAQPLPTLDAKTINEKYLSNVKSFFAWAVRNHLASRNPAEGIRAEMAKRGRRAKEERDPFSITDLKAIFASPMFRGCAGPRNLATGGEYVYRGHRFWAPLLGLFTGCRLNELGQLQVSDIRDIHGIPHIAITYASDDADEQKQLKSAAARRYIPVHPELQRLGFLDLVADARRSNHARLFPAWAKGGDGYFSSPVSKFFSRYLGTVMIKTDQGEMPVKTDLKSFHSFRHSFADALRDARLEDRVRDYFMGHDDGSVSGRYGSAEPVKAWCQDFQRICYEGLDLSALYPRGGMSADDRKGQRGGRLVEQFAG